MSEKATHPKSTCCIVGCARWSRQYAEGVEWLCGRHWRMARATRRRALRKLWRELDAIDRPGGVYVEPVFADWKARRRYKIRCWKARNMWKAVVREVMMKESGL